jgi:LacI family transcriptional regulator
MKDIARDLGVSATTISKALRNHVDISLKTRDRVAKRAQQLGYQPNWAARSLVTRRTYMVGLVIPDLTNPFFAEVAKGATGKLRPEGYHVIIANSELNAEVEVREIKAVLARNVDGLIITSVQKNGRWLSRTLRRHRVPFVLIDVLVPGVRARYVGVDDAEAGALATKHLIEQGCQRIAHIRGPALSTGRGRLRGYRRALAEHGFKWRPEYVVNGGYQDTTGYTAMQQLLRLKPPPDGVYCYNDPVAAGAIKAVFDAGLMVPDDVAIVGAGNVHYSDLLRTSLSTVDHGSLAMGETAAEQLLECIAAKKPCHAKRILIPVRLVVRESSQRMSTPATFSPPPHPSSTMAA